MNELSRANFGNQVHATIGLHPAIGLHVHPVIDSSR